MSRAAIAVLSTENLLHNLGVIKQQAPTSKVIALVKANAYGHGLRSVAMRLERGGVDNLGVASIDEALALRKIGVKIPITLMEGVFEPDELLVASCQQFDVVLHEEVQLNWLEQTQLPCPLRVWLKIDTGMGRLGFSLDQAKQAYQRLKGHPFIIQPIGIMSHFACSDDYKHPLNQKQIHAFDDFIKELPGPRSFANSGAIFHYPNTHHDVVRPGLALYGVSPIPEKTAAELGLRPVMTLQTRLIAVRQVQKGNSLGYGSRYTCPETMPVGVIAMGYGDGYPRTSQDGMPVLVNGIRCQVVGRVSMDMATIDLRSCPTAKVGDPVMLWGEGLPIEEVASFTAHIPYDLLCGVQSRVKFHWTMV